ncbi:hypothetical protein ACFSQP_03845 [Bizionia sediminis]|uniref:DUF2607 family protein n=1 Tax=Bizionia sediminis TaxID=1737064 RepID=A0ABW5KR69_9FLAO
MHKIKEHSLFKTLAILLVLAVLLPAAVKFGHIFENHAHEVCTNKSSTHLHEIDLDCEFYKFNLANQFFQEAAEFLVLHFEENHKIASSHYAFLSPFQQLHFSLRGPPVVIN